MADPVEDQGVARQVDVSPTSLLRGTPEYEPTGVSVA